MVMSKSCPYCGADTGGSGTCARCGRERSATGWRPDPTGRHEGRYYVTGHPTNRVREGRTESTDPTGGRQLPDYVGLPSRTGIRTTWLATGITTAVVVMVTAVAWAMLVEGRKSPPPPETGYLAVLKDAGLFDQFNSDANAVAHGRQVCRRLEDGEPQQGLHADKIAVDAFCPQFSEGFHVLETATVSGVFVLKDSAGVGAIASDGATCEGADGYSDVGGDTPVTVKSGNGEILADTPLGPGRGGTAECQFAFSFPVTEGQERYVVSIGRRGEFIYTFEQLRARGVRVLLGD